MGLLAACCAVVAACASLSAPDAERPPDATHIAPALSTPQATSDSVAVSGFEQQLRERATLQDRQGHLAEAATAWELLVLLRPDADDYRERLGRTRRMIAAAVSERQERAAQALRRGDVDAATAHYLSALALQPGEQTIESTRAEVDRPGEEHGAALVDALEARL